HSPQTAHWLHAAPDKQDMVVLKDAYRNSDFGVEVNDMVTGRACGAQPPHAFAQRQSGATGGTVVGDPGHKASLRRRKAVVMIAAASRMPPASSRIIPAASASVDA